MGKFMKKIKRLESRTTCVFIPKKHENGEKYENICLKQQGGKQQKPNIMNFPQNTKFMQFMKI